MAATETKIKQIAEKLDTLSPKQLDEVKHYSEYLLSTQEQRTKEKHLQYVSILRGIVSSFERVAITWDNDFLINSEIGYLYRAGRDFIRTSKDSFYAEIRKARMAIMIKPCSMFPLASMLSKMYPTAAVKMMPDARERISFVAE